MPPQKLINRPPWVLNKPLIEVLTSDSLLIRPEAYDFVVILKLPNIYQLATRKGKGIKMFEGCVCHAGEGKGKKHNLGLMDIS